MLRKVAQFRAKKLRKPNAPVCGVVLNGLNLTGPGHYYAKYYDQSYKDFYVVLTKYAGNEERRVADNFTLCRALRSSGSFQPRCPFKQKTALF